MTYCKRYAALQVLCTQIGRFYIILRQTQLNTIADKRYAVSQVWYAQTRTLLHHINTDTDTAKYSYKKMFL